MRKERPDGGDLFLSAIGYPIVASHYENQEGEPKLRFDSPWVCITASVDEIAEA
jgi:hypothetical protein